MIAAPRPLRLPFAAASTRSTAFLSSILLVSLMACGSGKQQKRVIDPTAEAQTKTSLS